MRHPLLRAACLATAPVLGPLPSVALSAVVPEVFLGFRRAFGSFRPSGSSQPTRPFAEAGSGLRTGSLMTI